MRSILLHIHDDDCLEARLQVALDLARMFGGHLTCAQAMPFELGVPGDLYGTMAAQMLPDIRKQADAVRERLSRRLAVEDVAWDWIQEDGLAREQMLRCAGLSDVIVLGSCEPTRPKGPSPLVGDIVLHARTPVLVVPPSASQLDCRGPALVAWDGSAEASRALRAAVPLLAVAGSVTLVTVRGESEDKTIDLPPTEGAEYLSRHGIGCEMADVPFGGSSVGKDLAQAASAGGASYLVMGAYGRPRLLETIWGGATRELFSAPPLPIFACH
jgi:nucleotide-binding universal stress UspA family protein